MARTKGAKDKQPRKKSSSSNTLKNTLLGAGALGIIGLGGAKLLKSSRTATAAKLLADKKKTRSELLNKYRESVGLDKDFKTVYKRKMQNLKNAGDRRLKRISKAVKDNPQASTASRKDLNQRLTRRRLQVAEGALLHTKGATRMSKTARKQIVGFNYGNY